MSGLLVRLRSALVAFGVLLGRGLRAVFGEVRWSPPGWVGWTGSATGRGVVYARQNPRRVGVAAAAVVAVLAGGYGVWRWYESLPKPVLTQYALSEPAVTCYACTPPGKPNPFLVTFSASAAPLKQVGKDVDPKSDAIRISPAIKGIWHWDDARELRFTPAQDWPVGVRYSVRIGRSLVARQVRLKDYGFTFGAPAFSAKIADTQFNQDPVIATDKKVVVDVAFSHPVDAQDLEKRISLTLFEKVTDKLEEERGKVPFTVIYDKLRLHAYIHTGQLAVPNKNGRVQLRVGPGVHAARGGNETGGPLVSSVDVPGLYSLRVNQVAMRVVRDERDEPSQALIIEMNHPVMEKDMPQEVHAWLLPEKHPDPKIQAQFEKRGHGPYPWTRQTLTQDVIAASQKLALTQIPGELEHYEVHSFRHEASPGRRVYVTVDKGLQSFGGYVLADTLASLLKVPDYPRELRIVQQGSLVAFSGAKTLTVLTRDIPEMHVEVGRLLPKQIQHLVSQTEGAFALPSFKSWTFQDTDLTERFSSNVKLPSLKPGSAHYEPVSLTQYLAEDAADRRGIFLIKVQGWDPTRNRPLQGSSESDWNAAKEQGLTDTRLVVVTDLGLLLKKSLDGSQDLFVQSIHTGEPLSEVHVDVLGRNGLPVLSGTTDAEGHVHFADLRSFRHEQEPVLYLARRGGDSSFLPIEERDRALDLSRFDVGGVANQVDKGALSAYLFSDRGLYRPGEEIRLGAIVRSQDWQKDLKGVPLRLDIVDPRGVNVRSEAFTAGPAGFAEIRHATRDTSTAGTYTVTLSIVRSGGDTDPIGSTTVQVRDFLPDRLKMSTHFSAENAEGWVSPDNLAAAVNLQNLFGTPAANRRVTAQLTLSPAFPAFRGYADYHFYDPQAADRSFSDTLQAGTTSDKGEATFALNLQRFARATYRVGLATEGFEADGGRGVSSQAVQLVSSMPYLVGWKPDGSLAYVGRDSQRSVRLLAIDPKLARREVKDLKLTRLESRHISALIRKENGTYQYESRRKDVVLEEKPLSVPGAGMDLALATGTPGSFAYVVSDGSGQKLARIEYQVAGDANLTRALEKNAELQITLSRKDYKPGDEIEMQIQAPYVGAGLITIERDKVYAWKWFRAKTTGSTQTVKLPEGIEGNAYVHVAFVRDPGSPEIYMSPLSYGVQPFSINLDARRDPVQLDAPELVKPGQTVKIGYSAQRPARIVIFAVDQGILQVANYSSPDPLAHFFQKRSLEVGTTQILDLILPEFRVGDGNAAPGGDNESALGRHLNPFPRKGDKPVAFWSGVLDATSTRHEVEYTVPDYFNGTLRIMAVAVADDAIGVQQTSTTSRGDFVLSPNAPTTVTPGDEFEVSVGVANNLAGSGPGAQVAVGLKVGAGLQVIGDGTQRLKIAENREASALFKLKALDRLGSSDLEFTAGSGASLVHRKIDLSVRPATPYETRLTAGTVRHGSKDVSRDRSLYPEFRTLEASVSLTPLSLAHGLVDYLAHYPWACTEQIVSEAFPALLLSDRPEFGYVRAAPGAKLEDLISELRVRQNEDGAYRLWPGGSFVAPFPSLYTQHFLIEAAAHGRAVPADLLHHGNDYLRAVASRDGNNLDQERDAAYAIYLLTRQGTLVSSEAAALRKRLTERYRGQWEQDLTAVWLAGALKLMRQDRDADGIIQAVRFGAPTPESLYEEPLTRDSLLLYVLSRHFPDRLPALPAGLLEKLAANVSAGTYDSLSASATIMALDAYAGATRAAGEGHLAIEEILKDKTLRPLTLPDSLMPKVAFEDAAQGLRFSSTADPTAFYLMNQSGFDRTPPKEALSRGFEILHDLTDASGTSLTQIKMGEEALMHLKVRAIDDRALTDVALVDLLPGGFELVIPPQPATDTYQAASPGESNTGPEGGEGTEGSQAETPAAAGGYGEGTGAGCGFCAGTVPGELRYADPREDRVVFYLRLSKEVQELVYKVKATNVGRYALPPAYGEAMYNRALQAHSAAGRIEVVRP